MKGGFFSYSFRISTWARSWREKFYVRRKMQRILAQFFSKSRVPCKIWEINELHKLTCEVVKFQKSFKSFMFATKTRKIPTNSKSYRKELYKRVIDALASIVFNCLFTWNEVKREVRKSQDDFSLTSLYHLEKKSWKSHSRISVCCKTPSMAFWFTLLIWFQLQRIQRTTVTMMENWSSWPTVK